MLDKKLAQKCMPDDISQAWEIFKNALCETVKEVMGKTHVAKRHVKGLPQNAWFDEECKIAKRTMRSLPKDTIEWTTSARNYNALKRRKRREHELFTETQAITNFKKNPKKEWRRIKGRKHDIMGDISPADMLAYVEQLYAQQEAKGMPTMDTNNQMEECFNAKLVTKGLKKLANGKAPDTLQFNAEMLKWTGQWARQWICGLLNQAIKQGLPIE